MSYDDFSYKNSMIIFFTITACNWTVAPPKQWLNLNALNCMGNVLTPVFHGLNVKTSPHSLISKERR